MDKNYIVIVGNLGQVFSRSGVNARAAAYAAYRDYCEQSRNDCGRAAGETVTLMVDGAVRKEYRPPARLPLVKDVRALLVDLKHTIGDEYRAEGNEECTYPTMQVTIGANAAGEWSYQTGDNSYTGGAYGFPYWGVIYLTRRSNSTDLARDAIAQIADLIYSERE